VPPFCQFGRGKAIVNWRPCCRTSINYQKAFADRKRRIFELMQPASLRS
jgi:hypothetical protein